MTLTADDTGVYARQSDRLDGVVQVGTASGRVVAVSFPTTVPDDAASDGAVLDRLFAYLAGEEDDFRDVTVALTVPTAQRAVLEAVRNVPYGQTVDLDRVATMAAGIDPDDEADRETVQTALRENPVPILVPDHRVRGFAGATPTAVASTLREIEGIRL
ncbi:MGMT family protein [Halobaculum sp. MBLA0147]|uniref:MGMT family protein n=1 Tax=Halobaculum sp. MBLA0147 TaxID=3079934 RepID=UPI0035254915